MITPFAAIAPTPPSVFDGGVELPRIEKYLSILHLDEKALKKVNSLRLSAENLEIREVAI